MAAPSWRRAAFCFSKDNTDDVALEVSVANQVAGKAEDDKRRLIALLEGGTHAWDP
jgi:hypothetical protein